MKFVATFYSHFGAIKFKKNLQHSNIECSLGPVPRQLSSSCGTCVIYENNNYYPNTDIPEEVEQIFKIVDNDKFEQVYKSED